MGFVSFFEVVVLGIYVVGNEVFNCGFGVIVSVGRVNGVVFGDRDYVFEVGGIVIDGCRG